MFQLASMTALSQERGQVHDYSVMSEYSIFPLDRKGKV